MFKRYIEIERLDKAECDGLLVGKCHIFPKLDGTNGSIWYDGTDIKCGSRSRVLGQFNDNFDFYNGYLSSNKSKYEFLKEHKHNWILYGEYLKPHSLKTYRNDMWNKFWVFDVWDNNLDRFLSYEEYWSDPVLSEIDCIPLLDLIENPSMDQLMSIMTNNTFGIKENSGIGEGIVIKNYDFKNKFGRYTWGKIVTNIFKEANRKSFDLKIKQGPRQDEWEFSEKYVTRGRIDKLLAKLGSGELSEHKSRLIPRFLETLYYEIITEEMYDFFKSGNKEINSRKLKQFVLHKAKELTPELF